MQNLLKKFRADLSKVVLDAIWTAWSQVGVMGHDKGGAARIVDPEPLLLLTWECARQDARVFDEVLDWLVRNGRWVNVVPPAPDGGFPRVPLIYLSNRSLNYRAHAHPSHLR
jgi:hypothetical protein